MTATQKTSPENMFWATRLEKTAAALRARNFGASVHATAKEAAEFLTREMLGSGWKGTVNFGGSASVDQSGVVAMLEAVPGADVIATHGGVSRDEAFHKRRREHFFCDMYLCSANAVTMDGKLVNVDGTGNRVASMIYGPEKVVLFVGRNKICTDLEAAEDRVRNIASPMNCMRLELPNPCVKAGRCMDCKSAKRICNYRVVTEYSNPVERIHVLLVNEDLGF